MENLNNMSLFCFLLLSEITLYYNIINYFPSVCNIVKVSNYFHQHIYIHAFYSLIKKSCQTMFCVYKYIDWCKYMKLLVRVNIIKCFKRIYVSCYIKGQFGKACSISSNIKEKGLAFNIVAFQTKTLSRWVLSRYIPLYRCLFTCHTRKTTIS